jgi:Domain of unknown function (DUF6378)
MVVKRGRGRPRKDGIPKANDVISKTKSTVSVEKTLQERGARYGKFTDHSEITQTLKNAITMHLVRRNKFLALDQQEALDMICHKIGRIVNGDPDYIDNWVDIAGYAELVAHRLNGESK